MPATKAKAPKSRDDQYARAAEIARKDDLRVKGVSIGEETMYVVVRPVNMSVHVVQRSEAGLLCDAACASSRFGNYCSHRAAVRLYLLARREEEKRHLQTVEETNRRTDATLARVSAALDASEARDTAMLTTGRADNKPFSLFR